MDKTKPLEIISARFQISRESARYFLARVQKSFKTEKPPHQLIVEFMSSQTFETLPRPYHIARMLNEKGLWAHPLNAEPREPQDEPDRYDEELVFAEPGRWDDGRLPGRGDRG